MDCLPQIHVAAIHAEPGHRAAVPGLGILCSHDDLRAGLGAFQNSNGVGSKYLTAAWLPFGLGGARFGAAAGVVTGYSSGRVEPLLGAVAQLPFSWGSIYALLTPASGPKPLTLSFNFTIDIP